MMRTEFAIIVAVYKAPTQSPECASAVLSVAQALEREFKLDDE